MASILETTAIALRRGSHTANLAFTGVNGELVADMGNGSDTASGTDVEATLRLHNGVTPGGIPMARADMRNVTTAMLAEWRESFGDKNLAYADLSNLEQIVENPVAVNNLLQIFDSYGIINTTSLDREMLKKANINFDNIDTADLAEAPPKALGGHDGLNLAYYNMSNVNSETLAEGTSAKRVQGKGLAYYDMSNVPADGFDKYGFEKISNKFTGTIVSTGEYTEDEYPNLLSVKAYIDSQVATKADVDMSNVDMHSLASGHNGDPLDPISPAHSVNDKNLAYADLSNLWGMSIDDATLASKKDWRVNATEKIPTLDEGFGTQYTYTLATVKQVREFTESSSTEISSSCLKYLGRVSNGAINLEGYTSNYTVVPNATISAFTINDSAVSSRFTTNFYPFSCGSTHVYIKKVDIIDSSTGLYVLMPQEGGKLYDSNFIAIPDTYIDTVIDTDTFSICTDPSADPPTYDTYTADGNPTAVLNHILTFSLFIPASANCSTATWPSKVHWLDGGDPPPLPTGDNYLINFTTYDGGTSYVAVAEGWSTARWD